MDARPPLFATSIFILWSWPIHIFLPLSDLFKDYFSTRQVPPPPTHPLLFREEGSLLSTINNRNLHPSLPHSLPPSCLLAYLFYCFFLSLLPFLILPLSSLHFCPPPSPIPNFLSPSSSPFPPSSSPPSLLPPSLPLSQGHVLVEVGCEIGAACRRAWWVAQGDRARRALASNCSPDDKQSKNRQQPL